MGNFNRERRSGGSRGDKRNFSGRRDFGARRDHDSRQSMHRAVCDSCGANCEVPFRPTSGKPIFCSNCFKKDDNRSQRDNRPRRDNQLLDRSQSNEKLAESIDNLNKKLDQILNILKTSIIEKEEVKTKIAKPRVKIVKKKVKSKAKAKTKIKLKVTKAKKTAKKKK